MPGSQLLSKRLDIISFTICAVFFVLKDYNNGIISSCMLIPRDEMLDLLDEYVQSLGRPPLKENFELYIALLSLAGILITVIEICIYTCFFHHLYKHQNSEKIIRLLDQETIKRRNKRNAVSFFGQFCSFCIEISLMIVILLVTANKQHTTLFFFVKFTGFTLMATIDVLTSNLLRRRFVQRWHYVLSYICRNN